MDKKSQQLGMSHSTACNRLKKQIMFFLLKKLDENICFRCNTRILDVSALSVEHKIAWQNNNPDLFWDLENIAFSHLGCNASAADRTHLRDKRMIGPEGTSWCSDCQEFRSIEDFGKNKKHWSGYRNICNPCRKLRGWENKSNKKR